METQQTPPNNQPADKPALTPPYVPPSWPGGLALYKYSKQAVRLNLWTLIIFFVFTLVLTTLVQTKLGLIGYVIAYLIEAFAAAGMALTWLAGVRGQNLPFAEAAKSALPLTLKMLGLTILVNLSLAASILLLVIPFFFVLPRLALANFFLVDKNMGVIEAYKASWNVTKGNAMKVWEVYAVCFLYALLLLTIIGIPFSIYLLVMYSAAPAVLYELLNRNPAPEAAAAQPQPQPAPEPPTNPEPPISPNPPSA
jgi:hypothetical protein